jgi:hypothetical protein
VYFISVDDQSIDVLCAVRGARNRLKWHTI